MNQRFRDFPDLAPEEPEPLDEDRAEPELRLTDLAGDERLLDGELLRFTELFRELDERTDFSLAFLLEPDLPEDRRGDTLFDEPLSLFSDALDRVVVLRLVLLEVLSFREERSLTALRFTSLPLLEVLSLPLNIPRPLLSFFNPRSRSLAVLCDL